MYIREDKPHRILLIYAIALLVILLLCLIRIDTVCKMQVDTLDQIVEVRQEVDDIVVIAKMATTTGAVLTAADYNLICRVVASEARGEGYQGQLAVAQVIRDRSELWGMSPVEVVTTPGQFAEPYQGEISPETMAAVNDCLILGQSAFDGPVTHFAEASITPYWTEGKEVVGVVGSHRFYF